MHRKNKTMWFEQSALLFEFENKIQNIWNINGCYTVFLDRRVCGPIFRSVSLKILKTLIFTKFQITVINIS